MHHRPFFLLLLLAAPALALRPLSLDLPGAPAAVISADVDADGRRDLAVVVAYNQWEEMAVTESSRMEGIDELVEVMTVVPQLLDRREVRVYRSRSDGTYEPPRSLALPLSVLALEAGPPGMPVVALTDDGASALALRGGRRVAPGAGHRRRAGDGRHGQLHG